MWQNPIKKEYDMLKAKMQNDVKNSQDNQITKEVDENEEKIIDLSTIMKTNVNYNKVNSSDSDIICINAPTVAVYNGSRAYDYNIIDMANLSKKSISSNQMTLH